MQPVSRTDRQDSQKPHHSPCDLYDNRTHPCTSACTSMIHDDRFHIPPFLQLPKNSLYRWCAYPYPTNITQSGQPRHG